MRKSIFLLFTCAFLLLPFALCHVSAQHGEQKYYPESDPLVLEKLDQWQDMKFGLLMHWGAYSQWGIVESWSICAEDEGWCRRKNDNYTEYKKEYENLKTTFNPTNFDPQKWASAAKDAGMKYVVFTTKHHDGFCMFDSKYTDYKITDPDCPFSKNEKANVALEIFDAFRDEGMWAGAYFSKPDWHNEDYWWPNFATPDRNVNYDIKKYPERWEDYVQFTHNQIMELMTDYGKMDILWLDGGWVAPMSDEDLRKRVNDPGYKFIHFQNQDIRMGELKLKAREKQPGLIVVDRAVPGPNQNYLTPENRVPEKMLPYPWESCIIAGGGWSWVPDAHYKSGRDAIHLLVDIVSKGGNLLFNIAPGPDGSWHDGAYELLAEIGDWMEVNNEAIYGSRPLAPYKEGNVCLTEGKDGSVFIIYLGSENEDAPPPVISMTGWSPPDGAKITAVGLDGFINWEQNGEGFMLHVPNKLQITPACKYAWVFRVNDTD
ncbi:MAG: alpha-L-fucosidase [Bacteroidetes bacterium]|nr:MAG: alpha-L-fucosidase [Bacteroidota bacterium]